MNEETSTMSAAPTPPPVPPVRKSKNLKWLIVVLIVVILGAVGTWYFMQYNDNSSTENNLEPTPTPTPTSTTEPTPTQTPTDDFTTQINDILPAKQATGYPEPRVSGVVTWHTPTNQPALVNALAVSGKEKQIIVTEVGKFNSGKYKDAKIYIVFESPEGPAPIQAYRIVQPLGTGTKYTVLQKYSDEQYDGGAIDPAKITIDKTYTLSDLDPVASLTTPENKKLEIGPRPFFRPSVVFFDSTLLKFVYNDQTVGAVFTTPDSLTVYPTPTASSPNLKYDFTIFGFYVKAPDGSLVRYKYIPEIVKDDVPQVTWTNGTANTEKYTYTDVTGCGGSNYASVVKLADNELVAAGKTTSGQQIFELKDTNHPLLKSAYEQYYAPENKLAYADYVKTHPLFFWKDPFARLIKFQNSKYVPLAECGKPVIYLYPEKTTAVNVQIAPQGGFTYTEPAYGQGWNVVAQPNGVLTNQADGKTYPYLFWEGRGALYSAPAKGWVVARSDIPAFLDEKLRQLGLVDNEIKDFKEYWLQYMQKKPYYFISFLGNSAMDQIAPLHITPAPKTVIRVLMDFEGLDQPKSVQGYEIKTPTRDGFTVVEWGGVKK